MRIKCPVCKKSTTWVENPYRPFCSERCRLIDLGKWASDGYKIEAKEQEEEEGARPPVAGGPAGEGPSEETEEAERE